LIFELRKKGLTQKAIGEIVGCTDSNVAYILRGKTWQV
jgi:transcriptional regulator